MINYEWDCRTVDVYPQKDNYENVVYNVHYRVTGEDTETVYTSDIIGTQILHVDDLSGFKSFDELTNEDVVAWCKAAMGEDQVAAIETTIASNIEDQINPASIMLVIN